MLAKKWFRVLLKSPAEEPETVFQATSLVEDILLITLGIITKWKYLMNHGRLSVYSSGIYFRI